MLKKCMKIELRKAFLNKMAWVACSIAIIISLLHAVKAISAEAEFVASIEAAKEGNPTITILSLFVRFIGADQVSFESALFFFLLPFIAVLPYGWSTVDELRSGYARNILSRTSRKNYFVSKYVASFSAATTVIIAPLLLNLIVMSLFLPALSADNIYPYGIVGEGSMWAELYYDNPLLYIGLYLLLDVLFAGLIAGISVMLAFFVKHKIPAMLIPFFFMLFLDYADNYFIPTWEISPIKFLRALPIANNRLGGLIILEAVLIFALTIGITYFRGRRHEAL